MKYVNQRLNTNLKNNQISSIYVDDADSKISHYLSRTKLREVKHINGRLNKNLNRQYAGLIEGSNNKLVNNRPFRYPSADHQKPHMKYFRDVGGQLLLRPKSVLLGNF